MTPTSMTAMVTNTSVPFAVSAAAARRCLETTCISIPLNSNHTSVLSMTCDLHIHLCWGTTWRPMQRQSFCVFMLAVDAFSAGCRTWCCMWRVMTLTCTSAPSDLKGACTAAPCSPLLLHMLLGSITSIHISSVVVAGWAIGMHSMTGMCTIVTDMKRGGNPVIKFVIARASCSSHCQSDHLLCLICICQSDVFLCFTCVYQSGIFLCLHLSLCFGYVCWSNVSCPYLVSFIVKWHCWPVVVVNFVMCCCSAFLAVHSDSCL